MIMDKGSLLLGRNNAIAARSIIMAFGDKLVGGAVEHLLAACIGKSASCVIGLTLARYM